MSIIHDALKKAARIRIKKEAETVVTGKDSQAVDPDNKITSISLEKQPTAKPKPSLKKQLSKKRKLLILSVVLASILILISTIFLLNNYILPEETKINISKLFPGKDTPGTISGIMKALPRKAAPSGAFVLSGIVFEDREPMAVINDTIYTVGEYVNGAEIVKITNKEVLLKKADREIRLKVK